MRIKTSALEGAALDWAVGYVRCLKVTNGKPILARDMMAAAIRNGMAHPSTDWAEGGPIIERDKLELRPGLYHGNLWSCWGQTQHGERLSQQGKTGPTPLVAAMRCHVASYLGEEVDVPEEVAS